MIELLIFVAGAVVGIFLGYRWGKQDAPVDAQASKFVQTEGGGGPQPEK